MHLNLKNFFFITVLTTNSFSYAQTVPSSTPVPAATQEPAVTQELAKAGALGDIWLGEPNAPVTVIEYAATTCSHCAHFNATGFPVLKQKYIDEGKAKYTLREFPLNPLDVAGFMLARCAGDKKYYAVTDLLWKNQDKWAFVPKPLDALSDLAKQAGFTKETFETCLKDQKIYDAVIDVRTRGEKLGVDSTPTFFINGKKVSGTLTPKDIENELEPLLKK